MACGGKGQGKEKGSGEGRIGQGGRGRTQGGERPMGTTSYGGKGSKGRAANGDRPVGAASCRREYTKATCQTPSPPGSSCNCCASPAMSRQHRCLRSCRAAGHSAVAECVHCALKMIAVWICQCVGARTRHRWGNRDGGPTHRPRVARSRVTAPSARRAAPPPPPPLLFLLAKGNVLHGRGTYSRRGVQTSGSRGGGPRPGGGDVRPKPYLATGGERVQAGESARAGVGGTPRGRSSTHE